MWQKPPLGAQIEYKVPGLVGCWLMNERSSGKVFDLSGHGNDGTHAGVIWQPGQYGPSCYYDGSNDKTTIADADILSFGDGVADCPFSIVLSVKKRTEAYAVVLSKSENTADVEYLIRINADEQIGFFLYDDSSAVHLDITSADGAVTVDEWTHLAFTYDGSGSQNGAYIYKNGADVTSTRGTTGTYTAMHNEASPVYFGVYIPSSASVLWGNINLEYVSFFKCVLTPSEITRLYREPFWMFEQEPIELWAAASGAAPAGISMPLVMQQMNHFSGGMVA